MKRSLLCFLLLSLSLCTSARICGMHLKLHYVTPATQPVPKAPVCFIGFGSGINNSAGILGLEFNLSLAKHVTLDAGVGPSTWGNKLFIGSKYYLRSPQRGFAFGGGFTFNSGQENRTAKLETINGPQRVTLTLKPQLNAFAAAYKYWRLGKRNNRFYTGLGWSAPVMHHHIKEVYGSPLSQKGRDRENKRSPGGLMLCFGFSFALYRA